MAEEDTNMDAYFLDELNDFQLNPPVEVWKNIEKELDRKKNIYFITIWTSLAAGIALFIGLGLYMFQPSSHPLVASVSHGINQTRQHEIVVIGEPNVITDTLAIAQSQKNNNLGKTQQRITLNYTKKTTNQDYTENKRVQNYTGNNNGRNYTGNTNVQNYSGNIKVQNYTVNTKVQDYTENANVQDKVYFTDKSQPEITLNKTGSTGLAPTHSPMIVISKTENENHQLVSRQILIPNRYSMINPAQDKTAAKNSVTPPAFVYDATNPFNEPQTPEMSKIKRWGIEAQVAPLYSYRNFTGTDVEEAKSYYNSTESGMISYAGVVKVNYQVTSRLSIQSGVSYTVMGYSNNAVYVASENTIDNSLAAVASKPLTKNVYSVNISAGKVTTKNNIANANTVYQAKQNFYAVSLAAPEQVATTADNVIDIQQFQFVEIPLVARYTIIDKHISFHVLGGFSSNILVSSNNYKKEGSQVSKYGVMKDLTSFNYSSSLGFGIGYKLERNMQLIIEPTCKYFINSISNNGYGIHPYAIGVYTGLNISF